MTAFDDLIADRQTARRYLIELDAYDPATQTVATHYYSDHGFVTEPADTPADQYFEPRGMEALSFERHLFDEGRIGGRSRPGAGTIQLANADGGLDFLEDLAVDGRRVRVLLGGDAFAYADFGVVFVGSAEQLVYDDEQLTVRLRDHQEALDKPVQAMLYAGTGGLEGGEDIEGLPKPLSLGWPKNVTPVWVDRPNLKLQVSSRAIEDVPQVYDRGDGSMVKVAPPPAPGQYSIDTTNGVITLGGSPAGLITADVKGDKGGGTWARSAADLVRMVATDFGGLSDPGDLDTASFDALDAANAAPVSLYLEREVTILEVLDLLVDAVGAWWGFDRAGKLRVGRLELPSGNPKKTFTEVEIIVIERLPTRLPAWRRKLGYDRVWTVQGEDDLAGSVSDARRDRLGQSLRHAPWEDPAVKTRHLFAEETTAESALDDKADAEAEVIRRGALYGTARDTFEVTVKTQPFALDLDDEVRLLYPRHGLNGGKDFRIIGLKEDSRVNQVAMTLWGGTVPG